MGSAACTGCVGGTSVFPPGPPASCAQILAANRSAASGVYDITLSGLRVSDSVTLDGVVLPVYCDMSVGGGGWTVFQRRVRSGRLAFNRSWAEYAAGFGDPRGEHWLGLRAIAAMTGVASNAQLWVEEAAESGVFRTVECAPADPQPPYGARFRQTRSRIRAQVQVLLRRRLQRKVRSVRG